MDYVGEELRRLGLKHQKPRRFESALVILMTLRTAAVTGYMIRAVAAMGGF